jgi:hypothetical protein
MGTKIGALHGLHVLPLQISSAEFTDLLKAECDEEGGFGRAAVGLRPVICRFEGERFRLRLRHRRSAFARVLYGRLAVQEGMPVLRCYMALRKEIKGPLALIGAVVAMTFLVLLYATPPRTGEEYFYILPLVLPLSIALLMNRGLAANRSGEVELLEFVKKLASSSADRPM